MPSTAIDIVTEAYRHHNLNEVTVFSSSLEFPYNIAKDIINTVIREMNRLGAYWFTETQTSLTYGVGVYQYSLSALEIDPGKILRIRKEATDKWGELTPWNWADFQRQYRRSAMTTAEPTAFSHFGNTLELNTIPDQDYSLVLYHLKDMPLVVDATDLFMIPERDEDVLIDACFQMLGYKIGRWDYGTALNAMAVKVSPLLADMKKSRSMPTQMPAAF